MILRRLLTSMPPNRIMVPAPSGRPPGAELAISMAVVILFGLLSATVLNMILVPLVYLRFSTMSSRQDV